MEELLGRLIVFLFIAGMLASIATPIFMFKIWVELKQHDLKRKAVENKPKKDDGWKPHHW